MSKRNIIVIGASAGGIEALKQLLSALPGDLDAAIFIVVHQSPTSPGTLAQVFSRASSIEVRVAEDHFTIRPRIAFVAPPDCHLVLNEHVMRLVNGPRENRHRPAVDPLFRSAAIHHGPRVVGVVLSGYLDDGSAGLAAIKSQGGIAVVQDPADAVAPGMPEAALRTVKADHIARIGDIAAIIEERSMEEVLVPAVRDVAPFDKESEVLTMSDQMKNLEHPGDPSGFSCPDCGGVLWELEDHNVLRFRCRIGHAYSTETMAHAQDDDIEEALWTALNILDESASLSRRLSVSERDRGNNWSSDRFDERARKADERAETIRRVLTSRRDEEPERPQFSDYEPEQEQGE